MSGAPILLLQCRLALKTILLTSAEMSVLQVINQRVAHTLFALTEGSARLSPSTQRIPFVTVRLERSRAKFFPRLLLPASVILALNYHFCQISMTAIEQLHLINCFSENPSALYINDAFIQLLAGVFVRTLTVSAWLLGMG